MIDAEAGTEAWARNIQAPHKTRFTNTPHDPARCCASVEQAWPVYTQCTRAPLAWYGTLGYCKQHDPASVLARQEARQKKWRLEAQEISARRNNEILRAELAKEALAALRSIADGHNDPRSLASEILAKYADI